VDRSRREWLIGVLESSRSWLDAGSGIWGCSWRTTESGAPAFDEFVNLGGPPVSLIDLGKAMPPDTSRLYANFLRTDFVGPNSRVNPREVREYFIAPLRPFGIVDMYMIHGRDTADQGICIGRHLRTRHAPRRAERRALLARLA